MLKKPTLIIIAGPTAVGKTELSIQVAKALSCEIISCDSRQIYRETSVGTAKPTIQELTKVKHHFINHVSIHDTFTTSDFEKACDLKLLDLFKKHPYVVMTGGTGLYIRSVIEGLDKIPDIDKNIASKISDIYQASGIEALQQLLKDKDPEYYEVVDQANPRRLMRALEIIEGTGEKFSDLRTSNKKKLDYKVLYFVLDMDRKILYNRIEKRVDEMIENGLIAEAKTLFPFKNLRSLQTVGYNEIFQYLENEMTLEVAIDKIKQHTRNYSKRQLTWFRSVSDAIWLNATNENLPIILNYLKNI